MGKGGKVDCRRNFKRSQSKDIGSDDSDEDYVVERDASDDESENFGESVDEYASEESFDSFIEEDEEEEVCRKVVRSKSRKRSRAKARNRKISKTISRKRKRFSYKEDEEDKVEEDDDFVNDEEDEDDEEDDDEEFTPDDIDDDVDDDFVDEDEDLRVAKRSNNMKVRRRTKPEKVHKRPQTKRRRNSRVVKKARRLKRKVRIECEDDEFEGDFIEESSVSRERSRKNSGPKRRNNAVSSDSEFVLSGSSDDDDYTISEEEREQVREAKVKANLRSSSSTKRIEEDGDVCQQAKPLPKKGKEKLKEVKPEIPKQVCGICLSEEDKRRFKGLLDCCSHYFCFTCIMEWSKVESRCPLCKQRFKTITKNGRTAGAIGVDLKNVIIDVPKRDQVYQPSEEEIRSFIDPYENVICTECHEGGDDGLMLLCDICDSPAHTYCVGLGRQVPEGNWYCDGCKPVALGSSSSQSQDPLPDLRATRPSPVGTNGENMANPGLESSPGVVFNLASPRFPYGDTEAVSPASVSGAPTLSVRRQLHRHIQNIISSNRMFNMASRMDSISRPGSQSGHLNPQIDRFSETSIQNSRIQDMSQSTFIDERLQRNDHSSSSFQNYNPLSLRTGHLRVHDPTFTASERPANLTLWPELSSVSSHQYNRPGIASEIGLSPHRAREESQFYVIKEQLESMVKTHLRNLSQDIGLGNDTLKEIVRSSTHTILAVCGLEHKRSEVQVVPEPSICCHGDRLIAGQTSIMKGFCSGCFESYVKDVVKRIMNTRLPPGWLSLGL